MTLCVNQSGTWRSIGYNCVNQSGSWRDSITACINQAATWRLYGSFVLGRSCCNGFLICQSGGTQWIVAPQSAEVSRNWYSRGDANTRAQQVTGYTGWFVPTFNQLKNPGSVCKQYWDAYCNTDYWTNSNAPPSYAWHVNPQNNSGYFNVHNAIFCVRSFKTI